MSSEIYAFDGLLLNHNQGGKSDTSTSPILPKYFNFNTSMILPWYFNGTSAILPWYFNDTSMVLQWYFNNTSPILPWYFTDTSKYRKYRFFPLEKTRNFHFCHEKLNEPTVFSPICFLYEKMQFFKAYFLVPSVLWEPPPLLCKKHKKT